MKKSLRFALAKLAGHTEVRKFQCGHTKLMLRYDDPNLRFTYVTPKGLADLADNDMTPKKGFHWGNVLCPMCLGKNHTGYRNFWRDSCLSVRGLDT